MRILRTADTGLTKLGRALEFIPNNSGKLSILVGVVGGVLLAFTPFVESGLRTNLNVDLDLKGLKIGIVALGTPTFMFLGAHGLKKFSKSKN